MLTIVIIGDVIVPEIVIVLFAKSIPWIPEFSGIPLPVIANPALFKSKPTTLDRTTVAVLFPTLLVKETTLYKIPSTPLSMTL